MKDYPAAHSMDTTWFAIDAEGNIAIFDSNENGAVPESDVKTRQVIEFENEFDSFWYAFVKDKEDITIEVKIPSKVIAERIFAEIKYDRAIPKEQSDLQKHFEDVLCLPLEENINDYIFRNGWFLWLANPNAIERLKLELTGINFFGYNYIICFAGEPTIIFVRECKAKIIQQTIEEGLIIKARATKNYRLGFATFLGIFLYEMNGYAPIPYDRSGKPIVPLKLEDLPENLQDAVSWSWFDRLRFSESETIQPIEHMPCRTWRTQWWVDTQGEEWEEHPY